MNEKLMLNTSKLFKILIETFESYTFEPIYQDLIKVSETANESTS